MLAAGDPADIAIQVAQDLRKAHEHGIVYRDIKPAEWGPQEALSLTPFSLGGNDLADRRQGEVGSRAKYVKEE